MDTQSCILTRRSVRRFTAEPVSHQEIETIISLAQAARLAIMTRARIRDKNFFIIPSPFFLI